MHLYAGLFLIAFSTLAVEIALVRLLSVINWYHLAFFAISTALLGMTAGAVRVYLKRSAFLGDKLRRSVGVACLGYAAAMPVMLLVLNTMPIGFDQLGFSLLRCAAFFAVTAACALPFYFSGVAVAAVLTLSDEPIGRLYATDLIGAALGCLFVLGGLSVVDAPSFLLVCAGLGGVAARVFVPRTDRWIQRAGMAAFVILSGCAWMNAAGLLGLRPRVMKGEQVESDRVLLERWNSYSQIMVGKRILGPPQYWGPSAQAPQAPIRQHWMIIDGVAGTAVREFRTVEDIEHLRYDITNVAYYLRPEGGACVIGVGGGRDLQSALLFGHERVLGVELNGILIELLTDEFATFAGLAGREEVTLVVDEARSYLSRIDQTFSLIQMSLVDTWAATGAGAYSLSENALYTVEGWNVFLRRLNPDGLFTVSRWHDPENLGETGRVVSLAVASLINFGVKDPTRHIAMINNGQLSTVILSRQPFRTQDLDTLTAVSEELGFEVALIPGRVPRHPDLKAILAATSEDALAEAVADCAFNLRPPTDDSPFFFNMLRLGNLGAAVASGRGVVSGNLAATLMLLVLLIALITLCVLTVVVPLLLGDRNSASGPGRWPALVYFSAIGAGFMFTEIGLMQKLSVFLGHPVYAIGVLLFTMILSAGLGSSFSDRLRLRRGVVFGLPLLASGAIVAGLCALSILLVSMRSSPMAGRIVASIAVIAPVGFLLGHFFPMGMRLVKARKMPETPWFWALNGAFGVLASALAVFVAIYGRISANFVIGAACYLALLLPLSRMAPRVTGSTAGRSGESGAG